MGDEFQTVSNQSWFSRIGNALKGIILGFIFIAGGIGLLFWNEGRAVHRAQTLAKGASRVIPVGATAPNSTNDGQLVHLSGEAKSEQELSDPEFGISTRAIALKRQVEMYQWREHSKSTTKKKLGGGTKTITTYSYDKGWSSARVDSSDFKEPQGHDNPPMPFRSQEWEASKVSLGGFQLAPVFISKIPRVEDLPVDDLSLLPALIREKAHESAGGLYLGQDPAAPKVGDLRVSFSRVPDQIVSIVGLQQSSMLMAYPMEKGSISLLEGGAHSADEMFQSAKAANKTMTWILRGVGLLVLLIGFSLLFKPLAVLADVIPFLGTIVGVGTGIVSFFLAITVGLITIAIGWLAYRPLLGVSLLVGATVVLVGLLWLLLRHKGNTPSAVPPPPPPPPAS